VSARSALTEGLDRGSFFSHSSQRCSWAQEPCKECTGQVKVSGFLTRVKDFRIVVAGVRRVGGLQQLDVVEGLLQGVHAKVFLKDLKVMEKSERIRPSNPSKGSTGRLYLEDLRRYHKFVLQVDKFHGGTLGHSQESPSKEQMDEILRGDFANLREPLDLAEVQGRYDIIFSRGSKFRRGRAVDPSHKGRWIYTYIMYRGFVN
jgi:hypothetical protein